MGLLFREFHPSLPLARSSSSVQSPVGSQHPFGSGIGPIQPVMDSRRLSAAGLRFLRHPLPAGGLGHSYEWLTVLARTPSGLPRFAMVGEAADVGVLSAAWASGIRIRFVGRNRFGTVRRDGVSSPKQSRCHPLSGAIPNATSTEDSRSSPYQPYPCPDVSLVAGYSSLGFTLCFIPHRCR